MNAPVPSADTRGEMPANRMLQLDRAERAIHALDEETRRLERIGFELPLARCRASHRYWSFVRGLLAVAASDTPDGGR